MRPCPHCDDGIANASAVQCGKPECARLARNRQMREYLARRKAELGERYEDRYRAPRIEQTCDWCKAPFARRARSRSCSAECQRLIKDASRRGGTLAQRRARRLLAQAAEGTRGTGIIVSGACHSCGEGFTRWTKTGDARFCTQICKRRESSARRRARVRGARVGVIHRHAIFERDGWHCQLCGDPVDRTAVVPHPLAATIDHIVALARGGEHSSENLQCAHFLCNSTKRDLIAV